MRVNGKIKIDGETYKLLAKDRKYLLLEKKAEETTEYIVLTGFCKKEDGELQWKRARYFRSREAAEQEIKDMSLPNKAQEDMSREFRIAKHRAAAPLERLVRAIGHTAVIETLAALINGKERVPPELKKWALTITGKQLEVNFLTNKKVIELWHDAKEMRLFIYHEKGEEE